MRSGSHVGIRVTHRRRWRWAKRGSLNLTAGSGDTGRDAGLSRSAGGRNLKQTNGYQRQKSRTGQY